ncbi:MAG: imidazole glycerol phosphate synthase subunit HisH [Acidimicrobiales bacterium]
MTGAEPEGPAVAGGRPRVAVLDYGIGNLRSAQRGLERAGADAHLTADPDEIAAADGVVLPGVGAFGACMRALADTGLDVEARKAAASGRPFLGICVGMQLLYEASEESPGVEGLGILPGVIRWLPDTVKRPQMQWNMIATVRGADGGGTVHPLMRGMDGAWLYFVHSLAADDPAHAIATTEYGATVVAASARDNVMATQFHPEKSDKAGLRLLQNYVKLLEGAA